MGIPEYERSHAGKSVKALSKGESKKSIKCQIKTLKISLNRVCQGRHFLLINFLDFIINFRNNLRKWKKKTGNFGINKCNFKLNSLFLAENGEFSFK